MAFSTYVAGFLFSENLEKVVLLNKLRPAWQAGNLNGVGGKINPGETPSEAMTREFREEAGATISNWTHYAQLTGEGFYVKFFRAVGNLSQVQSMTDEEIKIVPVKNLHKYSTISNVQWLVPMALSFYRGESCQKLLITEVSK